MRPEISRSECQGRVIKDVVLGDNPMLSDFLPAQAILSFQDGTFTCVQYDAQDHRIVGSPLQPLNFGDAVLIRYDIMSRREIDLLRTRTIAEKRRENEKLLEMEERTLLKSLLSKYPDVLSSIVVNQMEGARDGITS